MVLQPQSTTKKLPPRTKGSLSPVSPYSSQLPRRLGCRSQRVCDWERRPLTNMDQPEKGKTTRRSARPQEPSSQSGGSGATQKRANKTAPRQRVSRLAPCSFGTKTSGPGESLTEGPLDLVGS